MELEQIKIDLDKHLNEKHEENDNLIDYEVELDYNDSVVVFNLDSELINGLKKVCIIEAFIQFPDFEADIQEEYFEEIEDYLK